MQTQCSTGCSQGLDASSTLHGVGAVSQENHSTFYKQKAMSEILVRYWWGWQTIAQGYGCYLSSGLWNSKPASGFGQEKWATVNLSDPSQEWEQVMVVMPVSFANNHLLIQGFSVSSPLKIHMRFSVIHTVTAQIPKWSWSSSRQGSHREGSSSPEGSLFCGDQ